MVAAVDKVREHADNQRPQVGEARADNGDVTFGGGPVGSIDVVPCADMLALQDLDFLFSYRKLELTGGIFADGNLVKAA